MKKHIFTSLFVLFGILTSNYAQPMKSIYQKAVQEELEKNSTFKTEILNESDMSHLPPIVQKYIRYTGSVGKEKIWNFRAEFKGGIRANPSDKFMPLKSVQYNFMDNPSRLFYIVAKKMGIPAKGIHIYKNETAIMTIKLMGLFTVVDAKGEQMNQGETVTVFNDMCFMAPASLIDARIKWETIDDLTVKAIFTNGSIKISAILYFNEKGELLNFVSNDRFETNGKEYKNYPWSTPVMAYKNINGYRLPSSAKLIYSRPDGEFCYGEFELVNMEYNCKTLKPN